MNAMELEQVQQHAESIKNDSEHTIPVMDPGDCWCQGDVGLVFLGENADFSNLSLIWDEEHRAEMNCQLAPGNTQGSRHCVDAESMKTVFFYRSSTGTELDGPRIDAPKGLRVNHPEHGDVILPPGKYAVIYQQVWDQAKARRALD